MPRGNPNRGIDGARYALRMHTGAARSEVERQAAAMSSLAEADIRNLHTLARLPEAVLRALEGGRISFDGACVLARMPVNNVARQNIIRMLTTVSSYRAPGYHELRGIAAEARRQAGRPAPRRPEPAAPRPTGAFAPTAAPQPVVVRQPIVTTTQPPAPQPAPQPAPRAPQPVSQIAEAQRAHQSLCDALRTMPTASPALAAIAQRINEIADELQPYTEAQS